MAKVLGGLTVKMGVGNITGRKKGHNMVYIMELDDGFYLVSKDESIVICKLSKKKAYALALKGIYMSFKK